MKRASLAILATALLALTAAPALAKATIQKGKNDCTAAVEKESPGAKSVRIDDTATRLTSDAYIFTFKVKTADGADTKPVCTFNTDSGAASVAK